MPQNSNQRLQEFVQSYNNFFQFNTKLMQKAGSNQQLALGILRLSMPGGNINKQFKHLDVKTRAELRAIHLNMMFGQQMLPILFKNANPNASEIFTIQDLSQLVIAANTKQIHVTPTQLVTAIKTLEELVDVYLNDTYSDRVVMDYVVDFLKQTVNFLIMLLTFGYSQNFFETTFSVLEQTKMHHESLKSIYSKLTDAEQSFQLLGEDDGVSIPEENELQGISPR